MDQIEHFAAIAASDEKERTLRVAVAVRVGSLANRSQWARFVDQMTNPPQSNEDPEERLSTKAEIEAFAKAFARRKKKNG